VQMKNKHILLAAIGYMFFALGTAVGIVPSPYIHIVGPVCIVVSFVLVFILVRVSQPSRLERMVAKERAQAQHTIRTYALAYSEVEERAKQVRQQQEDLERSRLEYKRDLERTYKARNPWDSHERRNGNDPL